MNLTLREEWMEPDYTPGSLYESPFREMQCKPVFEDVFKARNGTLYPGSLEDFASALLFEVDCALASISGPIHLLLSGGYDSRLLAALLERANREPLYVTDGMEEPSCGQIMDLLEVPESRRYLHPTDGYDPYGLADAVCDGFAPLYQLHRFMPGNLQAVLVSGLGGGEWFSYPASGWLNGKPRRLPGDDVVGMWLDCWPQYTLIPAAWAQGYKSAVHPYCTFAYAKVASRCRPEWLTETPGNPPLDLVRAAMLAQVDERLLGPPWMPHVYNWNLSDEQKERIDLRFWASWVSVDYWREEFGFPSDMAEAQHACTLAGFATWCERLTANGYTIVRQ
jgi:hypothetical protein